MIKKNTLVKGIMIGGALLLPKIVNAGNFEVKHYTPESAIGEEYVLFSDTLPDTDHPGMPNPKLTAYTPDGQGGKLGIVNVDPTKYEKNSVFLGKEAVDAGTARKIRLEFFGNSGYDTRNLVLKQNPVNLNADPNIYDIFDKTEGGTIVGYVSLPSIKGDPNDNQEWYVISTNQSDLNFDGIVNNSDLAKLSKYWGTIGNEGNNWANFADIDRDSFVNINDVKLMAGDWLWDGRSGAEQLVSAYTGESRYDIQTAKLKKSRKAFAKRNRSRRRGKCEHNGGVNQAPALRAIGSQTAYVGKELKFKVKAKDKDHDSIDYLAGGLPKGASFENRRFSWTPDEEERGYSHQVTFVASDGELMDYETITIATE